MKKERKFFLPVMLKNYQHKKQFCILITTKVKRNQIQVNRQWNFSRRLSINKEIKIFEHDAFGSIRTTVIDDEPWFVGKDVAEVLGYADLNKAIAMHVDDEDKLNDKTSSSLGQRGGWFINESGLYSLILSSKMPKAKEFKRWVTSEVLPSIRKNGAYATDITIDRIANDPDFGIELLTRLKESREKERQAEAERRKLAEENKRLLPKAEFAEAIIASNASIPIGDFAKILTQNGCRIGRNDLFKALRDGGYLIKDGRSKNVPKQKYVEKGYFAVEEFLVDKVDPPFIKTISLLTPKGQEYFLKPFL